MLKYLWRIGSIFFLSLSGVIDISREIMRYRTGSEQVFGLFLISIVATLCLLCHDKATKAITGQSEKTPDQKA